MKTEKSTANTFSEGGRYSKVGEVIKNSTYVHGAETGPAYYIDDLSFAVRYNANKFVGNYTDGKQTGTWTVYERLNGNRIAEKQLYNQDGRLLKKPFYKEGKLVGTFSYNTNQRNGPARIYGNTEAEYASGSFENDLPVGTWQNAVLVEDGKNKSIKYSKGSKVVFESGVAVTSVSATGTVRSLKAEAEQREIKKQAAADSAANDEQLSLPIQTEGLGFYSNSYKLTDNAMYSLDAIANAINGKIGSRYQIKEICFSTHTSPLNDRSANQTTVANYDTMKYILSINRAYSIRLYLKSKLKDQSVKIYGYPCASSLNVTNSDQIRGVNVTYNSEERVQMTFNEELPSALREYDALKSKYRFGVQSGIIPNDKMKIYIVKEVMQLYQDDVMRARIVDRQVKISRGEKLSYDSNMLLGLIPPEFWLETSLTGVPIDFAQKENVKQFKEIFIDVLNKLNKKYDVPVEPITFFYT